MNNYAPDNIYLKYIKNNTNRPKKMANTFAKKDFKTCFSEINRLCGINNIIIAYLIT